LKSNKKSIKTDYLDATASLRPFYHYEPQNPDFGKIIRDKSAEAIDRQLLATVIEEQYQSLKLFPETQSSLDKLAQPNAFTLTTGHQLVMLGGPLFTTYKVLHIAKLAKVLSNQYPDYHFIPIFWIHTEDHDFEEINHYFSSFTQKHTYQGKFEGKVGTHIISDDIQTLLPGHFDDNLNASYAQGKSWATAFREWMHQLFGPYGVLMLDADDQRLKARFQDVLTEELLEQTSKSQINQTTQALQNAGYQAQITPRDINLFYAKGPLRNRILAENGHYHVLDTDMSFEKGDILQLVHSHPEIFSPNVSLRPLYQESILPNLAYIGGWGELSYWLQLKGIFEHYHVNFPLLIPRMSATLFTPELANKWIELGFELSDIEKPTHELESEIIPRFWDDTQLAMHMTKIRQDFEALAEYIEPISQTLPRSVKGQQVKNDRFFVNLEKKIHRVIKNSHGEFNRLRDIKQEIAPDGLKQERILSLAAFPEMSPKDLIKQLWEVCSPLSLEPTFLTLTF